MKRSKKGFAWWCGLLATSTLVVSAGAVGTRTFELQSGDDFKGGELEGVAIDSAGRVRPGFNLGKIPVSEGVTIWSALAVGDGSFLLGTGNEGKLLELKGATVRTLAETKTLAITSLAKAWGGAVVLGTLPKGEVMKWEGGKLSTLVKLDQVEHVWQVAYDPATRSIFAATGPEGKLFRIDERGTAQVYFDAEEQHLMSVAVGPGSVVYAGASDSAKLYKVTGPGRASVLYDFGRTEVRSIAVAKNGDVFAVANEITAGNYAPNNRRVQRATAGPVPKPPATKGKGTLYRFSPDGAPEELLNNTSEHFVSVAVGDDGRPYVGTGVEGRLYSVDENHNEVLVADTEERQVFALVLDGKERLVASSDPAVVHPVRGVGGADAVWTSKVLDAGLRARFGRMSWLATGKLELSTRSGNTEKPDDTWSAWSAAVVQPGPIASPAARYLQVRARFSQDPKAALTALTIPFVTDNLRAVLTSVVAGEAEPKTKTGLESSGGPISEKPNTTVQLKWKVENPDKDELLYRLEYRLVGTDAWYAMLDTREKVTKTSYDWETADLPEGRYRVRVVATDAPSNPPGRAKSHELESGVVLVDNSPPRIEGLGIAGQRIKGTAIDGLGPIARIEVSVAGSDVWYPFFPRDGVFDEQREDFDADLSTIVPAGRALISVRVFDSANNFVVQSVPAR
jgi:outer membrane protein assembly factor BamB